MNTYVVRFDSGGGPEERRYLMKLEPEDALPLILEELAASAPRRSYTGVELCDEDLTPAE